MRSTLVFLLGCSASTVTQQEPREIAINDPTVPAGVTAVAFAPGTYAGLTRLSAEGGCSQTHVGSSHRAGVSLTLAADGTARACRAMRHHDVYISAHMGPQGLINTDDVTDHDSSEQQGFSGRYTRRGAWIEATFTADERVCASKGASATATHEWQLECVPTTLSGLTGVALLCRSPGSTGMGEYAVGGVLRANADDRWLVLAAGDGAETHAEDEWNVAFHRWSTSTGDAPSGLLRGDPWSWVTP